MKKFIVLLLLIVSVPAMASDGNADTASNIWQTIWLAAFAALGTWVSYLVKKGSKWVSEKVKAEGAQQDLINALSTAVNDTYQNFVKEIKVEGKLTREEAQKAMQRSLTTSWGFLKTSEGRELYRTVGKEYLSMLVEGIITKMKGNKNVVTTVIGSVEDIAGDIEDDSEADTPEDGGGEA